jgi:Core-2/I-Branching enzyme
VSVAYIVLAHRHPDQLARLLDRLHHPGDSVFVHVDRRQALGPFVESLTPHMGTGFVNLARRRFPSYWAHYNLVAATLTTLEQALQEATFAHVALLSGEDYPLVPTAVIREFLATAGDRSFMFHSDGTEPSRPDRTGNTKWYWNGDLRRITYRHYRVGGRMLHVPNRYLPDIPRLAPPADLQIYQGSQWWVLSWQAARYVVETFVRRPELRRFFRRVQAPDEFALQMVLCNSRLAERIVNDDLHFISWQGSHARTLRMPDLPGLRETSKLFARKVNQNDDSDLLDALDELIESRADTTDELLARLVDHYLRGESVPTGPCSGP